MTEEKIQEAPPPPPDDPLADTDDPMAAAYIRGLSTRMLANRWKSLTIEVNRTEGNRIDITCSIAQEVTAEGLAMHPLSVEGALGITDPPTFADNLRKVGDNPPTYEKIPREEGT